MYLSLMSTFIVKTDSLIISDIGNVKLPAASALCTLIGVKRFGIRRLGIR